MLVVHKEKSTSGPLYSRRLDMPLGMDAIINTMKVSREQQILIFLKEILMLAQKVHHIENFIQNFYLRCFDSWGLDGICLRKITPSNKLALISQIPNYDTPLPAEITITVDSKIPVLEAIRFNVGIFFETRNALMNYNHESVEICNSNPEIQALVVLPITSNGEIWGTLELFFEKEIDCDDSMQDFFSCIAQIVGIAIDRSFCAEQKSSGQEIFDSNTERKPAKLKLTPKLTKIAVMIAEGKTNAEIARALSYSESAARYETVKLYAMLRVKNRAEAGAIITKMNLTQ